MLRLHLMAPFHFESDSWVRKLHLGQCTMFEHLPAKSLPLVDRHQPLGGTFGNPKYQSLRQADPHLFE